MAKEKLIGKSAKDWEELKLWSHQKEAIRKSLRYYSGDTSKSQLLKLPTGSGKTGISAVLSRLIPKIENVLVVVPSEALRRQNKHEINLGFWKKIDIDHNTIIYKKVIELLPSTIENEIDELGNNKFVGVLTIQALNEIGNEKPEAYKYLIENISLVVFDEGHREPAPKWSEAVRNLNKPTVLLTATPYRNDLKYFNVNSKDPYLYSHEEALKDKNIRKIEFIEIDDAGMDTNKFLDEIIKFYDNKFTEFIKYGIKNPKIIIRCNTKSSVREITEKLARKGKQVVGIHEEFKAIGNYHKTIPTGSEAKYWVHQYKLSEGIDEASFCIVVLFDSFSNTRSLVQQVGRIIRNPQKDLRLTGYVLFRKRDLLNKEWDEYLKYDQYIKEKGELPDIEEVVKIYINNHPKVFYVDNKFRSKLDYNVEDLFSHYRYRYSTNLFEYNPNISLNDIIERIKDELKDIDYEVKKIEKPQHISRTGMDADTAIISYLSYKNSNALLNDLFIEISPGYTIIRRVGRFLFYYDSEGKTSKYISDKLKRYKPTQLKKLLANANRFNQVTLLNTDLGKYSIRSKSLSAYSLNELAPSLNDHQQFCSTIVARYVNDASNKNEKRYIGFTKSRITDSGPYQLDYDSYLYWLDEIVVYLNNNADANIPYMDRFALFVDTPSSYEPINILIDLQEVKEEIEGLNGQRGNVQYQELCMNIVNSCFAWKVDGADNIVSIKYNDKNRYELDCPELETYMVRNDENKKPENLIAYLNRTQSFRLIMAGCKEVYAHNQFYKPVYDIVGRNAKGKLPILDLFDSYPSDITKKKSEKGTNALKTNGVIWHKESLFGVIARQGNGGTKRFKELFGFDVLVCNDLGTEESDFIGVDSSKKRVVFMHVKAPIDTKYVSASVFQEVCAQVQKNLDYLSPYSERDLDYAKWDTQWKGGKIGKAKRIVRGTGTSFRIFQKIKAQIKDPNSSKEVWIVMGNGFNKDKFIESLNKAKEPELVQIIYLITSTWDAVSQVGARLRVLC